MACTRGELVMFVGHPCGQMEYYTSTSSRSNQRQAADLIQPKHLFKANSALTFHMMVQIIIQNLEKNGKVFVLNDNINNETRTSIITGIKKKVTNVEITCCHFIPKYGELQCLWYSQWSLCKEVLDKIMEDNGGKDHIVCTEEILESRTNYSPSHLALTLDLEDYSKVIHYKVELICSTEYEFTFPGLVIEYPAIVSEGKLRMGIVRSCHEWFRIHPAGHVVVICQENEFEAFKSLNFTQHFQSPIHCLIHQRRISYLMPWVQYLFLVSLYHEGTIFVYQTKAFKSIADEVGTKSIRASLFADKPKMSFRPDGHMILAPPMIPSTIFINNSKLSTNQDLRIRSVLPLYCVAIKQLEKDSDCTMVSISVSSSNLSLKLAMFFKDKVSLENHEELFSSSAIQVTNTILPEFDKTTSSSLMAAASPARQCGTSVSPASPSSMAGGYIQVDLSKERCTESVAHRLLRKRTSSSSSRVLDFKSRPSPKQGRKLPSWMKV